MTVELERLVARIEADASGLRRELEQAKSRVSKFGKDSSSGLAPLTQGFKRLQNQVTGFRTAILSLGIGLAFRRAAGIIQGFQTSMAGVQAVTQASRLEMEKMEKVARELGATTVFSAQQAASGMEFLGRAGFNTRQIIASIPGSLDLAAAGQLELGEAADIASNVLSAFNLEAEEMTRVADVMAGTAARANTNVRQLAEGFKLSAPVAASFGVEIEEAAAAIGALSNNGLQGTIAATGFRRVLSELANPADELRELMGGLTLQTDGLTAVLTQLSDSGITATQAMQFFQERGGPAFNVLKNNVSTVRNLTRELRGLNGEAKRLAEERLGPIERASRELRSAIEELALTMGDEGLAGALEEVAKELRDFARSDDARDMAMELGRAMKFLAENTDLVLRAFSALIGLRIGAAFGPAGAAAGAILGVFSPEIVEAMRTRREDLVRQINQLEREIDSTQTRYLEEGNLTPGARPPGSASASQRLVEMRARLTALRRELNLMDAAAEKLRRGSTTASSFPSMDAGDWGAGVFGSGTPTSRGGERGGGESPSEETKNFSDAIKEARKELAFEAAQLGRSQAAQAAYNLAREAGVKDVEAYVAAVQPMIQSIIDTERAQEGLNDELEREQRAMDDVRQKFKTLEEATRTPAEQYARTMRQLTELRTELTELGLEGAHVNEVLSRAAKSAKEEFEELTDASKDTKDWVDDLGLTFQSAFEDAIVAGKSLSEVLRGIEEDIIRILVRKNITEPLAGFAQQGIGLIIDAISGRGYSYPGSSTTGGWGPFLGGSAHGSVIRSPTMMASARGVGIAGEAGHEAILPLRRGASGDLGVVASGVGGGGGTDVEVNVYAPPGSDVRQERSRSGDIDRINLYIDQAVGGLVERPGTRTHRALRSTFGARPTTIGR